MDTNCPTCGAVLRQVVHLPKYWLSVLECGECTDTGYLQLTDMRSGTSLHKIEKDVLDAIRTLDDAALSLAASQIGRAGQDVSVYRFEDWIRREKIESQG